ncbi:hypothetical protein JB92DRAFT_1131429 [Gautieria morchelliformis]|nr:hypothetical protein JB92DRAFT_1131429 [Gautieria morchelliformis]
MAGYGLNTASHAVRSQGVRRSATLCCAYTHSVTRRINHTPACMFLLYFLSMSTAPPWLSSSPGTFSNDPDITIASPNPGGELRRDEKLGAFTSVAS